jgi:hypothetical protein
MEVSDQLHAPAALFPENEPPAPIAQETGWATAGLEMWSGNKSLAPAGNRTQDVMPVAHSYTDWAIPDSIWTLYTKFYQNCRHIHKIQVHLGYK